MIDPPVSGKFLMSTTFYLVSIISYSKVIYNIRQNGAHQVKYGANLEFPSYWAALLKKSNKDVAPTANFAVINK